MRARAGVTFIDGEGAPCVRSAIHRAVTTQAFPALTTTPFCLSPLRALHRNRRSMDPSGCSLMPYLTLRPATARHSTGETAHWNGRLRRGGSIS